MMWTQVFPDWLWNMSVPMWCQSWQSSASLSVSLSVCLSLSLSLTHAAISTLSIYLSIYLSLLSSIYRSIYLLCVGGDEIVSLVLAGCKYVFPLESHEIYLPLIDRRDFFMNECYGLFILLHNTMNVTTYFIISFLSELHFSNRTQNDQLIQFYYCFFRVFHDGFNWWFLIWVWMTASLFRFQDLFTVIQPSSTMF